MGITFAQVVESLSSYTIEPTDAAPHPEETFARIELLAGQPLDPLALYVLENEHDSSDAPAAIIASVREAGLCEIAFVTGASPVQAMNAVTGYIARLVDLLDVMRTCYYEQRNLEKLCQLLSDFVGNPVIAYDDAIIPIVQVGFSREDAIGYFGDEMINPDWLLHEGIQWQIADIDDQTTSVKPYRSKSKDGSKESVACNVISEGKRSGMIEIFRLVKPISDADAHVLQQACKIVALAAPYDDNKFVVRKLRGEQVQDGAMRNWLATFKWREDDGVYIIVVHYPDRYNIDHNVSSYLTRMIRNLFPNAAHAVLDELPIMVGNDRIDSRDEALSRISTLVKRSGIRMCLGSSEIMTGIAALHEGYEHAKFASRYAYSHGNDYVARFDECRFAFLADACDFAGKRELVTDARVARMHADDLRTGSENTLTAQTYISSGFNLNTTAQALSVHRNTVVYRLKLMRERYGIDLATPIADPELVFQTLLSCRLLTEIDEQ